MKKENLKIGQVVKWKPSALSLKDEWIILKITGFSEEHEYNYQTFSATVLEESDYWAKVGHLGETYHDWKVDGIVEIYAE